jgi:putative peptide zinc metalloprotease protein
VKRIALALLLAIALLAGAAPTALAQDNSAVAVNKKDGSSVVDVAFAVKEIGGEEIDQTNAAVAYSNCQECQTVAIAIQILIVKAENPDVVTPTNVAIAINENCESCVTMALAYQFVVGGADLELSKRGEAELRRIRKELQRLAHSGLSAAELRDRTKELVDRIKQVLATELVPRREHGQGPPDGNNFDDQGNTDTDKGDEPQPPDEPTDTTPQPQQTAPQDTAPQPQTTPQPPPDQPQPQEQQPGGTNTTP